MVPQIETPKFSFHVHKPDSYHEKRSYIAKVKAMSIITPVNKTPIRSEFLARLLAAENPYATLLDELEELSVPKGEFTDLIEANQPKLTKAVNDFISSFNNAIERGEYPAAHRGYYGLPLDSDNLPDTTSRDKLMFWCRNLMDGEADRVGAGYIAMSHPDISTITGLFATFIQYVSSQRAAMDAYTNKEDELILMQPSLVEIINKCIDDTITYYNHLESSMMRKNCRKWAVKYYSRRVGAAIVFNVSIPINSTVNVAGLEVAPNTVLEIHNTSLTELIICLRTIETDACTIQNLVIPAGETVTKKASEIGTAENDLVNITNPSAIREGSCTITV